MQIRQAVISGQNQVELQDCQIGEALGPDEILVDTEYTCVSAGTELANYTGQDPNVFRPGTWCAYPWRPGYANVGIVRAVGDAVTRCRRGERVFCYGPHASAFRYPQNRLVIRVPEGMDPQVAAVSRMAGVAVAALWASRPQGSPWVAVYGLGTIGNIVAQSFQIRGCRVIGIDPIAARRDLAARCGIQHCVGLGQDGALGAIRTASAGRMAGIAVDAVGHSDVVLQALRATADHGELVLLGTPRVAVHGNITEVLNDVHMRMITIRGALEWNLPMYPDLGNRPSQFSKQEMIFDWILRGLLRIEPLISHRLAPEHIRDAYEGLLHQPETYTAVVLDWTTSDTCPDRIP